jgi:hypothetical protein
MRRICVLVAVIVVAVTAHVQTQTPPRPEDIIVIDGSKSPELIPQWHVWGYTFRAIAGGSRELPTSVLLLVSKDEERLIKAEADAVQKRDASCVERSIKTHGLLKQGESLVSVDAKMHAITVECRWNTLQARDRILEGLNPEARNALIKFAEDSKQGMTIKVPRNGLARYFEPQ